MKLENHSEVESINLDLEGQGALFESVPAIQGDVVHNLGYTGDGINVGVLDSGVNFNHPDLSESIVHQYHFLNQGADVGSGAPDQHGHGSNVIGIITSDGTIASKGVAPDANIVAIRVLDQNNRGLVSDWIAGVNYIVANNATLTKIEEFSCYYLYDNYTHMRSTRPV
ncbi:MAG: S8 family serine peptidase [bacterium]